MQRIALLAAAVGMAAALPSQTFFPPPPAPAANPVTTEKAMLGMALFWEEQLSSRNTVACGTCHSFANGGTDARGLGRHPGTDGAFGTADDVLGARGVAAQTADGSYRPSAFGLGEQVTSRKAPSMINVAYEERLFYDGRARNGDFRDPVSGAVVATGATALENVILEPPLNAVEMGHPGRTWQDVANKIAASRPLRLADQLPARLSTFLGNQTYPQLFQRAFGTPDVTPTRIIFAIASYLRTLVSDQTRFDAALAGTGTLTTEENRGRQLFETPTNTGFPMGGASCVQCHGDLSARAHQTGPASRQTTSYGQTPTGNFHNTGIRPTADDLGSGNGRFKVPMLRNVSLHSTFGHNGGMHTLGQVVAFYNRGGDFYADQAPEIEPRNLTTADELALVAFLGTLTDTRVQNGVAPFDSPRLGSLSRNDMPVAFGSPSNGMGPHFPTMVALEPMFPGAPSATLAVGNAAPNSLVAVLWDVAENPAGIDLLGVRLYVGLQQPVINIVGTTQSDLLGGGFASSTFRVPPELAGLSAVAQWLVLDGAAQQGLTASAAVRIDL